MEPRIEVIGKKKLVGVRLPMSLVQNRTSELWRGFMPRRDKIENRVDANFISMQVFDKSQGRAYAQDATFEKWAAAEVTSFSSMPEGMESYTLSGGKYAVFLHKGPASDTKIFRYIFGVWLPRSKWELDDREHFELLPPGYRPDDPNAEEEVWIPLR